MNLFEYESHDTWRPSGDFSTVGYVLLLCMILVLWLVAGAILTKSIIRQMPGFLSTSPTLEAKMALYQSLEKQDHVFIGSSRVHRQIDINIIERECNMTAYNFGIGGHDASNGVFILKWLLEHQQKPEKIWLEPIGAEQLRSLNKPLRQLYAPLWPNSIWNPRNIKAATKVYKTPGQAHVFIFKNSLKSALSVGTASELTGLKSPIADKKSAITNIGLYELGMGGYRPLDEKLEPDDNRRTQLTGLIAKNPNYFHADFTKQWKTYHDDQNRLAKAQIRKHAKPLLKGLTKSELKHVGLIYPPRLAWSQSDVKSIELRGVTISVMTFPIKTLPELGDHTFWIDRGHLNKNGAEIITRHLANQICG